MFKKILPLLTLVSVVFSSLAHAQEGEVKIVPMGNIQPSESPKPKAEVKPEAKPAEPKAEVKPEPKPAAKPETPVVAKPATEPKPAQHAQPTENTPRVVESGNIKPANSNPTPVRSKPRRPRPVKVVAPVETDLAIRNAQIVHSGLTKTGEVVYFQAAEPIGASPRPAIEIGALVKATVSEVVNDKKASKITLKLDSVTTAEGGSIPLTGTIDLTASEKSDYALATVGDKFTAKLQDKISPRRGKAKKPSPAPVLASGSATVNEKKIKVELNKAKIKGEYEVIIQAPAGKKAEDIDASSLALTKVNQFSLPNSVKPQGEIKQVDVNKASALRTSFEAWSVVKYLVQGTNGLEFSGKLKDGSPFVAKTSVTIQY